MTGVINDPLDQTHSPASSDHYFHLKFGFFEKFRQVETDERTTCVNRLISTGQVDQNILSSPFLPSHKRRSFFGSGTNQVWSDAKQQKAYSCTHKLCWLGSTEYKYERQHWFRTLFMEVWLRKKGIYRSSISENKNCYIWLEY